MESLLCKDKNSLTVKELEKLITYLSDQYYNGVEIVNDQEFDKYVDLLKQKDKNNKVLKFIGAPIRDNIEKVKLPLWLGSLDKVKPETRELALWLERYPGEMVISDKLDGISALLEYNEGDISLYTRGNGSVGQDISYLLPYLTIPICKENFYVRGELIIKKNIFEKKYSKEFPKARSVVSGVVNAKKPNPDILKDIDFLAYEYHTPMNKLDMSEQLELLGNKKFNVVNHTIKNNIDTSQLIKYLSTRREKSIYEIDGLVLTNNQSYNRNTSGNPKYAVAFKVNEKGKLTTVLAVEWQASKHGILIPRLKFEPLIIDGDTVQYCTAFHANFIRDNKIGKGSKIRVVKSGDVIPYVTEVVESTKASFPNLDYEWNESEVDIFLVKVNDEVLIRQLLNFFKVLEIDGVNEGIIKKLVNANYKDINSIYHASQADFLQLAQFKEKSANKLYDNIHKVLDHEINLAALMSASLVFGFGFGVRENRNGAKNFSTNIRIEQHLTLEELVLVEGYSRI